MRRVPVRTKMSPEDFLAWEQEQSVKHELIDGQVFAMVGGTPRHNALCVSVGAELRAALRGGNCHVLSSDQRLGRTGKRYVYPDVTVVCGVVADRPYGIVDDASIVVEVLSRATAADDRDVKWETYRRLPSLNDYLLVAQDRVVVEHYQRDPRGSWIYRDHAAGDSITLATGATIAVDDIYRDAFALPGELPIDAGE